MASCRLNLLQVSLKNSQVNVRVTHGSVRCYCFGCFRCIFGNHRARSENVIRLKGLRKQREITRSRRYKLLLKIQLLSANRCRLFLYNFKHSPLSGIDSRAATALSADLLSSSCFSNSCLTEFAFTLVCNVARNGSTRISTPKDRKSNNV